MKKRRLPKYLQGPFSASFYDYKDATIYLKEESGSWTSTVTYPSFFIKAKDKARFPYDAFGKYILDEIVENNYIRMVRDPTISRDDLHTMIEVCKDESVFLYEADVSPIKRWFSDTGSLVQKKYRTLFFDIETHPLKIGFTDDAKKLHRVISFAAMDDDKNIYFDSVTESTDEQEELLLRRFMKLIERFDTLLAWNGDDYDFFVLKARFKKYKIHINWKLWNLLDHLLVVKKILMSISDAPIKRSFRLDAIGESVLGIRKLKLSVRPGEMYTLLGDRIKELQEYNIRDVEIMYRLEQEREFLNLHYTICSLCRVFPTRASIFPNELADGMLLRLAIKEGRHFPTRRLEERNEDYTKFEGAFVMDPQIGFHKDIQVPDFASLYPSIILSWNMSNETKLRDYPYNGPYATATATGTRFRTDFVGMIPKSLQILIAKRNEYKKRSKLCDVGSEEYKNINNLSTAVKVITNSFYGLIGNEGSRFYDRDIARSVTLTGQLLIRETINYFKDRGYKTVYGDTDSVFVSCTQSEMKEAIDELNVSYLPKLLNSFGCIDNYVRLEYDKAFKTLLLVTKKRYVGKLALAKGRIAPPDMEPEIKGLETQRSDQVRYGQALLKQYMNLLIEEDASPKQIELQLQSDGYQFYNASIDIDQIEITKSVQKHPSDYNPKTGVVKVAERIINSGEEFFPGMKIPHVIVGHTPNIDAIHSNEYNGNFDRDYYWGHLILPPIRRLLEARFPDYKFQNFLSDKKSIFRDPRQTSLNFDNPDLTVRHRKVRLPMQRIRKVKRAKTTLSIPESAGIPTIKGISKLLKGYEGSINISINIMLDNGVASISTSVNTSREGLIQVTKLFPMVSINPPVV